MLGIDKLKRKVDAGFAELWQRVEALERIVKHMPTRQEFDALKAQLKQAIADETAQVTAAIEALREKLANGVQITDQDLTDLQEAHTGVQNIDPDQVAPTPSP